MPPRKKPSAPAALDPQPDPRAPLDIERFLAAAAPVLRSLEKGLLERADASPAVTAGLRARHAEEVQRRRTADPYEIWRRAWVEQVAAAWLLSVVFVRTLEDRGLVRRARIAGPGARDSQDQFQAIAPYLTERDYLLTVFREMTEFEAVREVFDAEHNLVWRLGPPAQAAQELLALFRAPSPEAPAFRFGQADTRFLGDLYEKLNEAVRERYALLQTPRFVESYILDRTLGRALSERGLDGTDVLDPTCGSGHFLLGAFGRLFDAQLRARPAEGARAAAARALGAVAGVDLNPYAVAIARVRLVLAYLEKARIGSLEEAPALPCHVVVADALLHGTRQRSLGEAEGQSVGAWLGERFALDDEEGAKRVLGRRYAVVVGNPPYITVKDGNLTKLYKEYHPKAASGKYSLAAPFLERFFDLARPGGYIGTITANSFMKREFGKKLIEEVLPRFHLDSVVNTAGAYIPGHGTPTVILFGRNMPQEGTTVHAVLAKRGEPEVPEDAAQGAVWTSIRTHGDQVGFENEYISVAKVARAVLKTHPWSLGGGGATDLKELLEGRAEQRLASLVESMGVDTITRASDLLELAPNEYARSRVEASCLLPYQTGEAVRDWMAQAGISIAVPYDRSSWTLESLERYPQLARFLWPHRAWLAQRFVSGGTRMSDVGLPYWAIPQLPVDKHRTPLSICYAEVATHNHFILDRGGRVFKQTAPIVKLKPGATEEDHLALLAYLNSSTACFWMKQVCHKKSNASQKHHTDPARAAYQFSATALSEIPVPRDLVSLVAPARELEHLAARRASWLAGDIVRGMLDQGISAHELTSLLDRGWRDYDLVKARSAYLQEEIDWAIYIAFGLCSPEEAPLHLDADAAPALGSRPFEHLTGYDEGVSEGARKHGVSGAPAERPDHWTSRIALLDRDGIRLIESREFKRMWRDTDKNVDQTEYRRELERTWIRSYLVDTIEQEAQKTSSPFSLRQAAHWLSSAAQSERFQAIAQYLGQDLDSLLPDLVAAESVPFLAAYRYTDTGLEKRALWEQTWDLQRKEDRGVKLPDPLQPPPRYDREDFRSTDIYRLRGPLDVPKERFIAYPACASDDDPSPLYGWAGWDHLQQAQALVALYRARQRDGWDPARLTPLLAGLAELLPWIHQWHSDPDPETGERPGDSYQAFLEGQLRALRLTLDALRAFRPTPSPRAKGSRKRTTASS